MKVHLLRSAEYDQKEFTEIHRFLDSFDGPLQFVTDEVDDDEDELEFEVKPVDRRKFFHQKLSSQILSEEISIPAERNVCTQEDLFNQAKKYRKQKKIPLSEPVFLLTSYTNDLNWFCGISPDTRAECFVHTDEWEHYVSAPAMFPVAYNIAALMLKRQMFSNIRELQTGLHTHPLGCMNDWCMDKKQIILKLRTADICRECMAKLETSVPLPVIKQVLDIFGAVRIRLLFAQNFSKPARLSRITIKGLSVFFTDYGNLEVRLRPLEMALYKLYMQHPKGIFLHDLVDHKSTLREYYGELSSTGLLADIHNRIDDLVNITGNSASEKISKIKAAFIKVLGAQLAGNYFIAGGNGEAKRISALT